MIRSIIQSLLSLKFSPIWLKKKGNKIYDLLNAETKQKEIFEINEVFYGFHHIQTLTPLIMLYGEFQKTK